MAGDLGIGFVDVLPRTDKFLGSLESQMTAAFSKAEGSAAQSASGITRAFSAVGTGLAVAGVAAVAAIGKGIEATTEWAGEVRALQRVTGQSAEDASALAAAGSVLGISVQQMSTAFAIFGKNIATSNTALDAYGVVTKDAQGNQLSFNEVLFNAADAIAKLPPGLQQTAAAQRLFGRSGRALLPILQRGRDGMQELYDAAQKAGLVMSQETLDSAKELTIAGRELGEAMKGASITIGASFVPVLTDVTHFVTQMVEVLQLVPQPLIDAGARFLALSGIIAVILKAGDLLSGMWKRVTGAMVTTAASTEEAAAAQAAEAAATAALTGSLGANTAALEANTAARIGVVGASQAAAAATVELSAAQSAGAVVLGETAAASAAATTGIEATAAGLSNMVPLLAIAYAGWKSFNLAVEEKNALTDGNYVAALNAVNKGLKLFGITLGDTAPDTQSFNEANQQTYDLLTTGALDAAGAAQRYIDTAKQFGITLPEDQNSLEELIPVFQDQADAAQAAADATSDAGQSADEMATSLDGVLRSGPKVTGLFTQMGTTATDFQKAAVDAAGKSDAAFQEFADQTLSQASDAWDQFKQSADDAITFTDDALSNLEDTASSAQDALKGDTSALSTKALEKLQGQAKLTGQDILKSFTSAAAKTKSFGKDLLELSRTGGQAGKDLAANLAESGDVLAAQVIADSPDKLKNKIVSAFGKSESAADNFSTKLTNAIVGPLENIQSILEQIAQAWGITINLDDNGAQASVNALKTTLQTISGQTYIVDIQGHLHLPVGPGQYASGAIIKGAGGFITHGPTYLVGEGGYSTPAGKGGEAVIPLNRRGADYMRKAWGGGMSADDMAAAVREGMSGLSVQIVDSNVGLVMEGVIDSRAAFAARLARQRRGG